MTLPFHAITVFAEDVREEVQGTISLIGVLPDTLAIPGVPGALPKIAIYTRAHVPIGLSITDLAMVVRMLDGTEMAVGEFTPEFLTQARDAALAEGKEYYGLVSHALISPFPVPHPGVLRVLVRHKGIEYLSGALILKVAG